MRRVERGLYPCHVRDWSIYCMRKALLRSYKISLPSSLAARGPLSRHDYVQFITGKTYLYVLREMMFVNSPLTHPCD